MHNADLRQAAEPIVQDRLYTVEQGPESQRRLHLEAGRSSGPRLSQQRSHQLHVRLLRLLAGGHGAGAHRGAIDEARRWLTANWIPFGQLWHTGI